MTTETPEPNDSTTERCGNCGRRTPHVVHVEIRQEGRPDDGLPGVSREPHRVATCRVCGTERSSRMDGA